MSEAIIDEGYKIDSLDRTELGNRQKLPEEEIVLNEKKALQRRLCLSARAALSPVDRAEKSRRISENLLELLHGLPEILPGATVLTYAAFEDEANPGLCVQALRKTGVRIAYPAIMSGRQMLALVPFDEGEMKPDRYGILTPDVLRSETVLPEELASIIVPCVGFDRCGRRLGHGAGYYDRYLVRCSKIPRILIAFETQELPEIATGPYDLPMDYLVTEGFGLKL